MTPLFACWLLFDMVNPGESGLILLEIIAEDKSS